jgi:hypothetical protein
LLIYLVSIQRFDGCRNSLLVQHLADLLEELTE